MRVLWLTSDHGFGHFTRDAVIIRALLKRSARHSVQLITAVNSSVVRASGIDGASHCSTRVDVGIVQRNSVSIDVAATATALAAFWDDFDDTVERVRAACTLPVDVVVFDVSPVGPRLASLLGVPSIALGNFLWSQVHAAMAAQCSEASAADSPLAASAAQLARGAALADAAYEHATHYIRLPLSYDPPAYLRERACDGPLVCNVSCVAARTVRSLLGIGDGVRVMTLSFGGHDAPSHVVCWRVPRDWVVIVVGIAALDVDDNRVTHYASGCADAGERRVLRRVSVPSVPHGAAPELLTSSRDDHGEWGVVVSVPTAFMQQADVSMADISACADIVVGKLGYGFCSEMIVHARPCLVVLRAGMPEEDELRRGMESRAHPLRVIDLAMLGTPDMFAVASAMSRAPLFDPHPGASPEYDAACRAGDDCAALIERLAMK